LISSAGEDLQPPDSPIDPITHLEMYDDFACTQHSCEYARSKTRLAFTLEKTITVRRVFCYLRLAGYLLSTSRVAAAEVEEHVH
jgi:hypothetical protein